MKIYTKSGDEGETGLFAGPRVPKDDLRIEAYGAVDELNATLGLARAQVLPSELDEIVERIQHELFSLGAELATPQPEAHGTDLIGQEQVECIEAAIDHWESRLPPLNFFVLPGGTSASASLHMARCTCRRAERRVVSLRRSGQLVSRDVLAYLNRLGDLLFVLARAANYETGVADIAWQKPASRRMDREE